MNYFAPSVGRALLRVMFVLAVGVLAGGCSSAASTSPPTAASSAPGSAGAAASALAAGATIDPTELGHAGKLYICTGTGAPPEVSQDAAANFVGFDPDVGRALAAKFGLQAVFVLSQFDTIIEAANTGKCDIIIVGQNVTPARLQAINMIPYWSTGDGLLVQKGNPKSISDPTSLCGTKAAIVLGSTEGDRIKSWSDDCTKAGKPAISMQTNQGVTDALQELRAGQVDEFLYEINQLGYYVTQNPTQFEVVPGQLFGASPAAISVPKTKPTLDAAIIAAIKSMQADGSWKQILTKWGFQTENIPDPAS